MKNNYRYLLLFCLLSLTSSSFSAQPPEKDTIKQTITEILAKPEFSTYREEPSLRYIGEPIKKKESTKDSNDSNSFDFSFFLATIATFFEWLLWIAVAVIIGLFIFYNRHWLGKWRVEEMVIPPSTATPEWKTRLTEKDAILPDNIAEYAWHLWQSEKQVEAISLLYRGALAVLTSRDKLAVQASATEGECVYLVKYHPSIELSGYFSKLTGVWQKIAYSHRSPTDKEVKQLCEQWNTYFSLERIG